MAKAAGAKKVVGKVGPAVQRWTLDRQAEFLAQLAMTCNVRASARAVGMSEQSVHRLRLRSPEFRDAWALAIEEGYVRLEIFLLERAINGTEKPLLHKNGEQIGSVVEHSDRLALALYNARRPATFRLRPTDRKADRAEERRLIEGKLSEMNKRMGGEG
jgi:hypothetical protein